MHAKALEIAWHDKVSPIFSTHISIHNRLLSAGGDKVIRVWRLHTSTSKRNTPVEWLCDLTAHTTTPNIARFSPDGHQIATGADGGEIIIWQLSTSDANDLAPRLGEDPTSPPKERWQRLHTLRAHVQDVLDLAWSPDGAKLVSASVDNAVMVWELKQPTRQPAVLRQHANFVQGVCIDPFGRLVASLGNDRTLRVFTTTAGNQWTQVAAVAAISAEKKLFAPDAKFLSCFRRLAWSPDGSVLACPSGVHLPVSEKRYAVHLFARNCWNVPVVQCGGLQKPACAVRFSPVLYRLREGRVAQGVFAKFEYRMVFAVVCTDAVLFYDTQRFCSPFAKVQGLHCAEHTDVAWAEDGKTVAISSLDGYVSLVCFKEEEVGLRLEKEKVPSWLKTQQEMVTSKGETVAVSNKMVEQVVRPMPRKINFEKVSQKTCNQAVQVASADASKMQPVKDKVSDLLPTVSPPRKKGVQSHRVTGPLPAAMKIERVSSDELDQKLNMSVQQQSQPQQPIVKEDVQQVASPLAKPVVSKPVQSQQASPTGKMLKLGTPKRSATPRSKLQTTLFSMQRSSPTTSSVQNSQQITKTDEEQTGMGLSKINGVLGDKRRLKEKSLEEQRRLGVFDDMPSTKDDEDEQSVDSKRRKVETVQVVETR